MPREMPMMEARKRLSSLPEEIQRDPERETIVVTRRGKPVLALMDWELYESIMETMEIMGDPEAIKALRESIRDLQAGRIVSLDEVRREIDL